MTFSAMRVRVFHQGMRAALGLAFPLVAGTTQVACSKQNQLNLDRECEPGSFSCDGAALLGCNQDHKHVPVATCDTDALCAAGIGIGQCAVPVCDIGDRRCDGAEMVLCGAGHDRFDRFVCASGDECRRGLYAGQCKTSCTTDGDCQGQITECAHPACVNGACTTAFAAMGKRLSAQIPGDCQIVECDGSGAERAVANDADPPAAESCASYQCSGGTASVTYAAAGSTCDTIGTCDGSGTCRVCQPGDTKDCVDSSTQRWCGNNGTWENKLCTGLTGRCDHTSCYGGTELAWIPDLGGSSYGIDRWEVTRAQYADWLASSPLTTGQTAVCSWNSSYEPASEWPPGALGQLPVVYVDFCDATAYCKAVGKRLCGHIGSGPNGYAYGIDPTESQWFNACSSGGAHAFTYGATSMASECNGAESLVGTPLAVGTKASCHSPDAAFAGVFDLSGNVKEWEDSCEMATGAADSCYTRGGGFETPALGLRCDSLSFAGRSEQNPDLGFRCCAP